MYICPHEHQKSYIMKKLNLVLIVLASSLFSCVRIDCSNLIDKTYSTTSFDALDVSHAFEVELIPSDRESVELRIPADAEKYVVVEKKGSTLHIGMKKGLSYYFVKHRKDSYLKAFVSFKEMKEITGSGASDIDMKGSYVVPEQNMKIDLSGASSFGGDMLEVNRLTVDLSGASGLKGNIFTINQLTGELSGASNLKGNSFTVNRIKLELSGASELDIKGSGNDMEVECSGASEVEADKFPIKNFSGSLSGASEADLYVTETFSGSASGASDIKVKGRPHVLKSETSGGSSITFE